ncbi:hypothetical protein C8T65DRAFT_629450, partial [Cerioporus squamosus]
MFDRASSLTITREAVGLSSCTCSWSTPLFALQIRQDKGVMLCPDAVITRAFPLLTAGD